MQRPHTPYKNELYHEVYEIIVSEERGDKTVKRTAYDSLFLEDAARAWRRTYQHKNACLIAIMDYELEDGRIIRRKYVWMPYRGKAGEWQRFSMGKVIAG